MAIKICGSCINFGSECIITSPDGIVVNGVLYHVGLTVSPTQAQGSVSGYNSGGNPDPTSSTIDKFPFASSGNATDVGELSCARRDVAGNSSSEYGYTSTGRRVTPPTPQEVTTVERFPFASDSPASAVGFASCKVRYASGQNSTSSAYITGGLTTLPPGGPSLVNVIGKFPFAGSANFSDVAELAQAMRSSAGQSSRDNGYHSGGEPTIFSYTQNIQKFPFSSNTPASIVASLSASRGRVAGQNSIEHGYTTGGYSNVIDKFPFAADSPAVDVGDITGACARGAAGQSSTTCGYTSGGVDPGGYTNIISKFSFANDGNAVDQGDLTRCAGGSGGHQV